VKRRDIIRELERLGYKMIRDDGNHTIFYMLGKRVEQVPRHNEVNERTAKKLLERARKP